MKQMVSANLGKTIQPPPAFPRPRQKPRAWWVMLILALLIALYGFSYLVMGERRFVGELGASFRARPWGIYTHAFFAAIALAVGPLQFHRGLLLRWRKLHRNLGKIYIIAALLGGGLAGFYLAWYSQGGWTTHLGFGLLALVTFTTTLVAYLRIRRRNVPVHREWMIRSYAAIFAAVTLRIWLPLLVAAHGGAFIPAYRWVAWVSWVPNLVVAEWYIRRSRRGHYLVVGDLQLELKPDRRTS